MLIPCDEVNRLNTFRVMIILRLLLLLTNLHLKLLSTQGTGADKLLSTQRVKQMRQVQSGFHYEAQNRNRKMKLYENYFWNLTFANVLRYRLARAPLENW